MKERKGDLFKAMFDGSWPPQVVCITTNGFVKKNGEAVMGAGIAKQFKEEFPQFPLELGGRLHEFGNQPFVFAGLWPEPYDKVSVVTLPVKHHWREQADPELVVRSIRQLEFLTTAHGWSSVWLPRPGCGNGRLDWESNVKPLISPYLDKRFTVFHL